MTATHPTYGDDKGGPIPDRWVLIGDRVQSGNDGYIGTVVGLGNLGIGIEYDTGVYCSATPEEFQRQFRLVERAT